MPQNLQETRAGQEAIAIRPPEVADAREMRALAERTGLDLNSEYSYLMVCRHFRSTSTVAIDSGRMVGFVSGFLTPESPSELFIWQIAVAPEERGRGIAGRMLDELITRLSPAGIDYVQATINPSNEASQKTFRSLAGRLGCEVSNEVAFSADDFSGEGHEEEVLHRIGPFKPPPAGQATGAANH